MIKSGDTLFQQPENVNYFEYRDQRITTRENQRHQRISDS